MTRAGGPGGGVRAAADRADSLLHVWLERPLVAAMRARWRSEYGLVLVALGAGLVGWWHITTPRKYPDFTVLWAAATHAFGPVYDQRWLTGLQHAPGERPFSYPPTFLLLLIPIGWLKFRIAYVGWMAASVAGFVAVARRWSAWGWLAVWSPTLMFAALIGQTTLLVGAAAGLALAEAERRPIVAGVALGLAGCIKPQLVYLLGPALMLWRAWAALGWAAASAALLAAAAAAVFGPTIWGSWLASLAGFVAVQDRAAIDRLGLWAVSPWLAVAAGVVVAVMLARAARARDRAALAIVALGGGLLLSPHAVFYDSAVLLIPALAMIGWNWRAAVVATLLVIGAETSWAVAAVTLLLGQPRTPLASTADAA